MHALTIKNRNSPRSRGNHLTRLCYVVTNSWATSYLAGQLAYLRSQGFEVTLITSPGKELDAFQRKEGVESVRVPIERSIRPWRDFCSLVRLFRAFRSLRPQIVNAGTPKAGLLGMLAAWAARVPVRIYVVHGLRLETTRGLKRRILAMTERIASACAHRVICVSQSLADQYIQLGLADRRKVIVLGAGSANGVDAAELAPTPRRIIQAHQIREQFGISPEEPVIGYVGRLARDKGIADLVQAFAAVSSRIPTAWLLLVGDFDKADALDEATTASIRSHPRIVKTGFIDGVAPYYHAMNVVALPSFREGFPTVILEAQAAGLPTVGYQATGVVDAILDGVTGRLVPIGAVEQLAAALLEYLHDPKLAAAHGASGQGRAKSEFSNQRIWNALLEEYHKLLGWADFKWAGVRPHSRVEPPGARAA